MQQMHVKKARLCQNTPTSLWQILPAYLGIERTLWSKCALLHSALLQDLNTVLWRIADHIQITMRGKKKSKIKRLEDNCFNSFCTWSNYCLDGGRLVGEIVGSVIETADTTLTVKLSVFSFIQRKTQLPIPVLYLLPWLPKRALT